MKILGITDETTTCECCGKTNLKKTVVLETQDGGEVRYGTDCAARALLGKKSSSNRRVIEDRAKAVQYMRDLLGQGLAPKEACDKFNRHGFYGGYGAYCYPSKSPERIWVANSISIEL